jgi:hypothetical protein
MNASTLRQVIDTADEVRELRARVADLEEGLRSLRAQLVILREACYDLAERKQPTGLSEVGAGR